MDWSGVGKTKQYVEIAGTVILPLRCRSRGQEKVLSPMASSDLKASYTSPYLTPTLTKFHPGSKKGAFAHFLRWRTELLQPRQLWVERMRVVARRRQSGRRGSKGAGLCVGSSARGGGARGCSCDRAPRGSHRCSVAAGAEGLESSLGVPSRSGAAAAVPPELGPSTPGGSGPLDEGLTSLPPLTLPSRWW